MVDDIVSRVLKRIEALEEQIKNAEYLLEISEKVGVDVTEERANLETAKAELQKWKEAIETTPRP